MAKMLKALRNGDATPDNQSESTPRIPPTAKNGLLKFPQPSPQVSLLVEEEVEEAFPFIEVGANRQIEGSADVMAIPVPPRSQSQEVPSQVEQQDAESIVFEPWDNACGREMSSSLVVYHEPESQAAQPYFEIVDRFVENYEAARTLLFPTWTGSGAAATVLNLAFAACARHDKKVAVIDLHLKQPELAAHLGLPNAPGLADVLAGRLALQQAFQATSVENLFALPTGVLETDEELQWSGDVLPWIMSWLRSQFDLSFIYAPELSTQGHQGALASLSDAVFPILGQADQNDADLSKQLRGLQQRGACIAGVLYVRAND